MGTDGTERQRIVDAEHLKLLALGYFVSAALNALMALFGLLYASLGLFFTSFLGRLPHKPGQAPPPEFMGWIFGLFGLGMFTIAAGLAALKLMAGLRLRRHRGRTLCMVVAGICCLGIPYGTMLGVFTFMVLSRPSVTALFESTERDAPGERTPTP